MRGAPLKQKLMRQLVILISFLFFNHGMIKAQENLDSTTHLISRLIEKVNNLPRTNISGQGDFSFQGEYSLSWDKKKRILTLTEKRYQPNSEKKMPDQQVTEIDIQYLHRKGVYVKSLDNDSNISLKVFTANNDRKIKRSIYVNGASNFGMYHDRFTIGSWDSLALKAELDTIKKVIIEILDLHTTWEESDSPDIKKIVVPEPINQPGFKSFTITHEQNDGSPIFLNSTIEEPALFMDAKSANDNLKKINDYVFEHIKKNGIKFNGKLSGILFISESGKIEDFKSLNMNRRRTEQLVREIILSMPQWKAGKHNGEYVRVTHTILIKK